MNHVVYMSGKRQCGPCSMMSGWSMVSIVVKIGILNVNVPCSFPAEHKNFTLKRDGSVLVIIGCVMTVFQHSAIVTTGTLNLGFQCGW